MSISPTTSLQVKDYCIFQYVEVLYIGLEEAYNIFEIKMALHAVTPIKNEL